MEYEDKMKKLPSGIYKTYLVDKIFSKFKFSAPVLEIGCGTGEFLDTLEKHNLKEGDLIDLNKDTIKHCKNKCIKLSLQMKVYNINLFDYNPKMKYHSIFMFEILEHIKNDEDALKKIFSLLNTNGLFLMSVPAKQSLFSREDAFQGHLRRYEKKDIYSKLDRAGFTIEILWCYNPLPYITRYVLKRGEKPTNASDEAIQKTKDSSHVYYPMTQKMVDMFYPIYSRLQFLLKIQNIFLNTDFGAHYLILLRKK